MCCGEENVINSFLPKWIKLALAADEDGEVSCAHRTLHGVCLKNDVCELKTIQYFS